MNDLKEREMEYRKRKLEYLKNQEPEARYDMFDIGTGFIVRDRLAHMNREEKCDYLLQNEMMTGMKSDKDDRYYTKDDFMELVNDLDRTVNGNFQENSELNGFIVSKKRLYKQLESNLDVILNDIELMGRETFKVVWSDVDYRDMTITDQIQINVEVYRKGMFYPITKEDTTFTEKLLGNALFDKIMVTINKYQDELEQSNDSFDAAKVDALIELKMRIFEEVNKDSDLKGLLELATKVRK